MTESPNPLKELPSGKLAEDSVPDLEKIEEVPERDYDSDMNPTESIESLVEQHSFDGKEPSVSSEEKPLVMKQGDDYVVVGRCKIDTYEGHSIIYGALDTAAGHDVGQLMASGMITAVSVGAILDPEVRAQFAAAAGN